MDGSIVGLGAWEMRHELFNIVLDEEDSSGLKGLDKAGREAHCNAVLHPRVPRPSDSHLDVVGLAALGGRADMSTEFGFCVTRRREFAAVDVSGAVAVVEGNIPRPTGGQGCGRRKGIYPATLRIGWRLQGDGTVVQQVLPERDERFAEGLVQQQSAETCAVHVQVRRQFTTGS